MNTDSPEAVAAKSEGWAAGKAKRRPLVSIVQARQDPFAIVKEYAGSWGKLVIRGLKEAGVGDDEIAVARKRMIAWMKIVETHNKEIRSVLRDARIPVRERGNLVRDMLVSQEQIRREMFG